MIRRLMRIGLRKGVFDGSRTWMTIGLVAGGLRLLRRMARNEPDVVFCEELPEGGVLVIANKPRDADK